MIVVLKRSAWVVTIVAALETGAVAAADMPASEWTAGPVQMRMSPCLIAHKTGKPGCPEPKLLETGEKIDRIQSRLARAQFFIDVQELPQAMAEVDQALLLGPDSWQARLLSARIAMAIPDIERAKRDVKLLSNLRPNDPDVMATAATLKEWVGDPYEAAHDFNLILKKHPTHIYSRFSRARILMEYASAQAALPDLDILAAGDRPDDLFLAMRASANVRIGNLAELISDYNELVRRDPVSLKYLTLRAEANAKAGRYRGGIDRLRRDTRNKGRGFALRHRCRGYRGLPTEARGRSCPR